MTAEIDKQPESPTDQQFRLPSAKTDNTTAASPEKSSIEEDFSLTKNAILAFASLAIFALMTALDGTSISVALPV